MSWTSRWDKCHTQERVVANNRCSQMVGDMPPITNNRVYDYWYGDELITIYAHHARRLTKDDVRAITRNANGAPASSDEIFARCPF